MERSKEYDILFVDSNNCFGKMFSVEDTTCSVDCKDSDICNFYMENVKITEVSQKSEDPKKSEKTKKKKDSSPKAVDEVVDEIVEEDEEIAEELTEGVIDKPPQKKIKEVTEPESEPKPMKKFKLLDKPSKSSIPPVKKERVVDENGFRPGTKVGLIASLLAEGKYTKKEILDILNEKYVGKESGNQVTLSLVILDIQKPVGTYSASRGWKIVTGDKGVLTLIKPTESETN